MLRNILTALAVSISLLAGPAWGSAIYSVDRDVGVGSVKGTIVTDGSIGDLAVQNILDWSITVTDAEGSFLLTPETSLFASNTPLDIGIGLTATSGALLFDFDDGEDYFLMQRYEIGDGGPFWFLANDWFGSGPSEVVYAGPDQFELGPDYEEIRDARLGITERSGTVAVATSISVPAPGSLGLLAIGIAGVTLTRKVRR